MFCQVVVLTIILIGMKELSPWITGSSQVEIMEQIGISWEEVLTQEIHLLTQNTNHTIRQYDIISSKVMQW